MYIIPNLTYFISFKFFPKKVSWILNFPSVFTIEFICLRVFFRQKFFAKLAEVFSFEFICPFRTTSTPNHICTRSSTHEISFYFILFCSQAFWCQILVALVVLVVLYKISNIRLDYLYVWRPFFFLVRFCSEWHSPVIKYVGARATIRRTALRRSVRRG